MDYKAMFWDLYQWTQQANEQAQRHDVTTEAFWAWVAESSASLCRHYDDHRLAKLLLMAMEDWLNEAYDKRKGIGG